MKNVEFVGFESLNEALTFRCLHGGWIFHADEGPVIWFRPEFTPSRIKGHPVIRGLSGTVLGQNEGGDEIEAVLSRIERGLATVADAQLIRSRLA